MDPVNERIKRLETLSPSDKAFIDATASTDAVFPVSQVESQRVSLKDKESLAAFEKNDFVLAQSLANTAKELEKVNKQRGEIFELVKSCSEDAFDCMERAKTARDFLRAGEWKQLLEKLQNRLTPYVNNLKSSENKKRSYPTSDKKKKEEEIVFTPQVVECNLNNESINNEDQKIVFTMKKQLRLKKRKCVLSRSTFEQKLNRRYKWKGCEYDNYLNQSFSYAEGETYCCCCEVKLDITDWAQHIHGQNGKDGKITKHMYALDKFLAANSNNSSQNMMKCETAALTLI